MSVAALVLFGLYVVVAFVVRTLLQVRRTCDSGIRGLSGSPGAPEWWAGVLFAGALLLGLLAPVAGLLGVPPLAPLDRVWLQVAGIALAVLGTAGALLTQVQMGASWRIGVGEDERTELVTTGLFGVVRNPFFTATLLTAAGLALMVPNGVALAALAALVVAVELQVRVVEEPYLRTTHPEAYGRYLAMTGRFLPGIG